MEMMGDAQHPAFSHPKMLGFYFDQVYHQAQFIRDLAYWGNGTGEPGEQSLWKKTQKVCNQENRELVQQFNSLMDLEILPDVFVIPVSVVNSQVVLPHPEYLVAREVLPNPFPEPMYWVERLEFWEDLDMPVETVPDCDPQDGSMHMPVEYLYYDDNNKALEADQEEADDWWPGSIPSQ